MTTLTDALPPTVVSLYDNAALLSIAYFRALADLEPKS